MITENVDRRVLGAARFVSVVDGMPVPGRLQVRPLPVVAPPPGSAARPPVRILRNRLGLYVIHAAPGFETYLSQFDPPPDSPELGSLPLRLQVIDPTRRYFPAVFTAPLPRSLDSTPVNGGYGADTVFAPMDVPLFPAPSAPVADGWAVVRALIWREIEDADAEGGIRRVPLPGAMIRVLAVGDTPRVLSRGIAEWRRFPGEPERSAAEALAPVPGIPVTAWNEDADGSVLTQNQPARLQARFDTTFVPGGPDSLPPDLARLDPPGDGALPEGVVSAELAEPLTLRARTPQTVRLVFDPDNQLRRE